MLYLITQIGIWLAIAAVVFFILGYWIACSFSKKDTDAPEPENTTEEAVPAKAAPLETAAIPVTHSKETLPEPIIQGTKIMNINNALMKADEGKSLKEICTLPVSTLQGVSEGDAEKLQAAFGIKTVQDLADCKYFKWAAAISTLAACEE